MKNRVQMLTAISLSTIMVLVMVACAREHRSAGYRINAISPEEANVQEYSVWTYMGSSPFDIPGSRFTTRVNDQLNAGNSLRIAASIPTVRNTIAFVHGNQVVVGLELDNVTHDTQIIKHQVRNAIEAALPGLNIHVTTNPIMNQRVKMMSSQLFNAQRNLFNDIGTLIRDIDRNQ